MPSHLHLFANCRIVDGYARSAVHDLQKGKLRLIPKGLSERLRKHQNRPYDRILEEEEEDRRLLQDSLQTLQEEGYITFLAEHEVPLYPDLELRYENPRELETLVVQYHALRPEDLNPFGPLGLRHLILLLDRAIDLEYLNGLIDRMEASGAENLILLFDRPVTLKGDLLDTIERRPRISRCVFFGAEKAEKWGNTIEETPTPFRWDRGPFLMTPSMELFMESLHHHSYFNKRLFISPEGYLEASYASRERALHIEAVDQASDIRELLNTNLFKDLWGIPKEATLVCKDCEFRRTCLDPRIPSYHPNSGYWQHQNPCSYNPYSNEWQDEEDLRSSR